MEQIRSLSQLLEYAKRVGAEKGPKKISVAMAEDAGLLEAIEEARKGGFAEAILVGNGDKMQAAAEQAGVDLANYELIDERPVLARLVHRAVDGEAGGIDLEGRVHHLLAREVHLHEAGGGDLHAFRRVQAIRRGIHRYYDIH